MLHSYVKSGDGADAAAHTPPGHPFTGARQYVTVASRLPPRRVFAIKHRPGCDVFFLFQLIVSRANDQEEDRKGGRKRGCLVTKKNLTPGKAKRRFFLEDEYDRRRLASRVTFSRLSRYRSRRRAAYIGDGKGLPRKVSAVVLRSLRKKRGAYVCACNRLPLDGER